MFKEAGSQTERQQLREDNLGFRGVNMHTTMIRQHIEFQRRLQEYGDIYGVISPQDQHILADHERKCEELFNNLHQTHLPFLSQKIQEGNKQASFLYEVLLVDGPGMSCQEARRPSCYS